MGVKRTFFEPFYPRLGNDARIRGFEIRTLAGNLTGRRSPVSQIGQQRTVEVGQ